MNDPQIIKSAMQLIKCIPWQSVIRHQSFFCVIHSFYRKASTSVLGNTMYINMAFCGARARTLFQSFEGYKCYHISQSLESLFSKQLIQASQLTQQNTVTFLVSYKYRIWFFANIRKRLYKKHELENCLHLPSSFMQHDNHKTTKQSSHTTQLMSSQGYKLCLQHTESFMFQSTGLT